MLQYVDETITEQEDNCREHRYQMEGKRAEYLVKIQINDLWIDPTYIGNLALYVNHSCRPNVIQEEVTLSG